MSRLICIKEILGIAGLVGVKRTDIVETLFGIREKSAGTITLPGKQINNHNANEAINHGFALVTEERRSTGIYAYLDIGFNSLISNIRNYKNKVGLLDNSNALQTVANSDGKEADIDVQSNFVSSGAVASLPI